ncbi:uncharacterized protein LOC123518600 isoform X2 [Portunus trituberculatus]|uniref:uncharacterized protein LOC123518600 isoform X2 n=1 Tax=Portunus trituberculatus TaxID=210409 RepID=UPI001E1CD3B1|nr:uncharacterized protein LOC123518600 isoform X2 [Portunus trituberculatus]
MFIRSIVWAVLTSAQQDQHQLFPQQRQSEDQLRQLFPLQRHLEASMVWPLFLVSHATGRCFKHDCYSDFWVTKSQDSQGNVMVIYYAGRQPGLINSCVRELNRIGVRGRRKPCAARLQEEGKYAVQKST